MAGHESRSSRHARVRVLIADDHPLYRDAVARALKQRPELELVGEAADGRAALAEIRRLQPDIALLDIALPGLDGIAVLDALSLEPLATRVVFLSAYEDSETVYRAFAAGGRAYLPKVASADAICDAIVAAARGETVIAPEVQAGLARQVRMRRERDDRPILTARELEVLRMAADGASVAETAQRLCLSANTVKTHLQHIYDKLEVSDRAAAVAQALRQGLLQ